MHSHLVFIVLDHQGEKTNLDRTTDLKEPGAGGLPLQNKGQKGEIHCSPGSIVNQQTWQVKWERRLGTWSLQIRTAKWTFKNWRCSCGHGGLLLELEAGDFKTSLFYIINSRTAQATQRDPTVSQSNKIKQKKMEVWIMNKIIVRSHWGKDMTNYISADYISPTSTGFFDSKGDTLREPNI